MNGWEPYYCLDSSEMPITILYRPKKLGMWGGGGGGGDISTPASRQSCSLVSRTYKVATEMPHRGVISVSRLLTTMDTKPLACRAQYGFQEHNNHPYQQPCIVSTSRARPRSPAQPVGSVPPGCLGYCVRTPSSPDSTRLFQG